MPAIQNDGPSSSQLGFAIGWHHGGLAGAGAAWLGFTLPSALIMVGLAHGLFALGGTIDPLIHGLLVAAVAVVAKATLGLGNKLCPVWTHGIRSFEDFGIGLAAFLALHTFKAPAWTVVLGCGLVGYF